MRAFFVVHVAVLSVLLNASCTEPVGVVDDGDGCVIDGDCPAGQLCMNGSCQADPDLNRCAENAECDAGFVCRGNACVAPPTPGECQSDDDCEAAETCGTADGECFVSPECAAAEDGAACDTSCWGNCAPRPTCSSDADCAPTERCDAALSVCLPIGDCAVDTDCPVDAVCDAGACVQTGTCTADTDCPVTQSCIDGSCGRNDLCDADGDCPSDQRCIGGTCNRRDPCSVDDDCAFDETCVDGTCNVIGTCTTVDDCPQDPNIACLDGVCSRAPCGRNSDCDNGLFCDGSETCNPREGCAAGVAPSTPGLPACATETCDEDRDVLIPTAHADRCSDNSPCTDDVCDLGLGCVNPVNAFQPAPGPLGDCERTACVDGAIKVVAADDEVPTDVGVPGDCVRAICQGGARVVVKDDTETPAQTSATDCKVQVCSNGVVVANANDSETPTPGPTNDCNREICQGGLVFLVDANDEVPPQGPVTDCTRQVCSGGRSTSVADDTEVPMQGPANDCTRQTCSNSVVVNVANDSETPPQGPANDCKREVCSNGASTQVGTTAETPPQRATTDCTTQTCSAAGTVVDVANNAETPAQLSTTDCTTQTCSGGAVVNAPNNAEVPPQNSPVDCKRQTCSGGAVVAVNNDAELPADVGCKDGVCVNGSPTTSVNDGNCVDAEVCTVGTCNVDGTCAQTPQDGLCSCGAGQTGICRPDDPRAPNSGNSAGCVCLTPTNFICGVDDGDFVKPVLDKFQLFASPAGAAGTTFTWDLVGTPAGADPAAQLLANPTVRDITFFQATTPSALGVKDYVLRVTIQEPDLPAKTCDVRVEAQKIPDTLEVTLFMNDPLDVDLHLISGVGATFFDFPFHQDHDPLVDNEDRDCYWDNCAVCTVAIPGQSCLAISPRQVDFDMPKSPGETNEGLLADDQDPQLDIDNQRGCFTAANGDLQCIPEKITVVTPDAGTYRVFTYLWGNALALNPGLASTPASTTVSIQMQCRGVTKTVTRTLSSLTSTGTLAGANDPARYANDPLFITIPASGPCTLP